MAIYYTVTAKATPAKLAQAIEWALKVSTQTKNAHRISVEVLTNLVGDAFTITWLNKFDSLTHFEAFYAKQMVDADYMALVEEANEAGLFPEVSSHMYQIVG